MDLFHALQVANQLILSTDRISFWYPIDELLKELANVYFELQSTFADLNR